MERYYAHHDGLQWFIRDDLERSAQEEASQDSFTGKRFAVSGDAAYQALFAYLKSLPALPDEKPVLQPDGTSFYTNLPEMLHIRMLLSCLCDADYTAMASHEDASLFTETHRQTALFCSLLLTAGAVQLPAVPVSAAEVYAELYVSPDGDDSNAGTKAAPLKTLAGARDAVRKCRDGMTGDIIVNFRGGVYRMTEAVAFDTRDSAPDADYVFPASCATTGDTVIPIRSAGSGKTVWFAPDGTTAFNHM